MDWWHLLFCLADHDRHTGAMKTIVHVTAAVIVNDGTILIAQRHPRIGWPGCGNFPAARWKPAKPRNNA